MVKFRGRAVALIAAVAMLTPPSLRAQAPTEPQGASFDFVEADVRTVLSALASAGGLNIVFGTLPARPVTLRTAQPVPVIEIPAMIRSIAEANGLRVQIESGFVRISVQEPQRVAPAPTVSQPQQQQEDIHVYRLRHVPAAKVASVLQALLGATISTSQASSERNTLTDQLRSQLVPPVDAQMQDPRRTGSGGSGTLHIVADESTNSLLVRGSPAEWERVQRAVQLIDVRPLQVLIEVLIAEVRRTRNFGVGTEISVPDQDLEGGGRIGGGLESQSPGDFALNVLSMGNIRADIAVRALSSRADITVLSRPVIIAQNNTEARIMVGSQRPFIQVSRALPTDAGVRDQVVQYRDVGTSLTITPTINPDGYVNLDIVQEISTATSELQFGAPVISTREASTSLLVRDKQTAVIGGLVDRQRDRTRSGVPLLKDIPLIGFLFGSHRRDDSVTELFLFLTPHVIRTDEEAEELRRSIERNTEELSRVLPDARVLIPDTIPPPR